MNLLLGITGSIAAFKAVDVLRQLRQHDINVRVVLTSNAEQFVTRQTLQTLSNNEVRSELFDLDSELAIDHIELAKWADIILIAPATANIMAKLAYGFADDLLTTLCLASDASVIIAPAMNQLMWQAQATQDNYQILKQRNYQFIGPELGLQACGDNGPGRMSEADVIVNKILENHISEKVDSDLLKGLTVMITAGPTREAIDPVRFISNHSSGKMGYSIARAAKLAGANVILVSGPVNLPESYLSPLTDIQIESVFSASQMLESVNRFLDKTDIFISCAAVADYRPVNIADSKIKKSSEQIELKLVKNPDIIHQVALSNKVDYIVGFAAETENLIKNAEKKLFVKQLDMIVANQVAFDEKGVTKGFNSDENQLHLLWKDNKNSEQINSKIFKQGKKQYLAIELIKELAKLYKLKTKN
ncbi:MAG: bifunctional phosphopantothenoylcysteine decarboxylase/phosphopantothenate--cysteine ligase CoaBC [Gammaproteobacteria bacterium]|nr:bifunctional phosphopantothenoylcysteine decarboxylase/phosphopantothenate--cysteine ligase CoaBC [Gammaproteobacteria bacterium]